MFNPWWMLSGGIEQKRVPFKFKLNEKVTCMQNK